LAITAENRQKMGEIYPLRILIAEDNRVNQMVAKKMLANLSYETVDVVENGRLAVAAAQDNQYDLILMDIQMPRLDGLSATQEIRNLLPADRQPYIVALTANALKGDREHFLAGGMDSYLSKPVRLEAPGGDVLQTFVATRRWG
jgi:CheY-like chemotaxis protein